MDRIMRAKCALIKAGCVGGKLVVGVGITTLFILGCMFSFSLLDSFFTSLSNSSTTHFVIENILIFLAAICVILISFVFGDFVFNKLNIKICKKKD